MWSDSHCHLFDYSAKEMDELIASCQRHGVDTILNIGTDLETSQTVLTQAQLLKESINTYAAAGISAADVGKYIDSDTWEEELRTLLDNSAVAALGEIGIDSVNEYYAPFDTQLLFFRKQLEIAKDLNVPVIIHSRGVEALALEEVLKSGVQQAVFHCFTGDAATASAIAQEGFYVSFSGIVTFKRSDFDDVIRAVPMEKLLIETDSPYLAPVPMRGKKNSPAWVFYVGSYVAGVLGVADDAFAEVSSRNLKTFLGL